MPSTAPKGFDHVCLIQTKVGLQIFPLKHKCLRIKKLVNFPELFVTRLYNNSVSDSLAQILFIPHRACEYQHPIIQASPLH